MGCESIIKCIFISFLTGAGISAALLIFNHNSVNVSFIY